MLVINATHVRKEYSGVGVYFFSIAGRLTEKFSSGIIYAQYNIRSENFFKDNFNWKIRIIKYLNRDLIRWLWVQLILPFKLLNKKNILYCSFNESPVFCRCKTVTVVHDLIPLKFEKEHSKKLRFYYKHILPRSLKKTSRIVAISEAVKKDILAYFPFISGNKIEVIYNGYEKNIFNNVKPAAAGEFKTKLGIDNYILYVGRLSEVKNTMSLIKAFGLAANKTDVNLLIVGRDESGIIPQAKKYAEDGKFSERIKFIDYMAEEDLANAYRSARLFVFPSYSEGFGLPLVEAMASGVPAVISRIPSLTEIAGGAAIIFDPDNYSELSEKILLLLNDEKIYNDCRAKGLERAKVFDWDQTAGRTGKIISDLI
jgi:glycosyltransferase involved in cell wall biosynthesis